MRVFAAVGLTLVILALVGAGVVFYGFYHFGKGLPDHQQLAGYEPPVATRVHAGDGRLMAEFAREKRVFVPVDAMPKLVIKAFLAAEDQRFYSHPGIDVAGIARAAITNLKHMGTNRRPIGASTITQQVAKNFLLTNEVSVTRKVREVILALRIERALSKDRILELYLNEIYLGYGSYGVAAAALNYFNKSLDDLTVSEAAFLAGLPKAPNNYNPRRFPEAARSRRDYVLNRMEEDGYIPSGTTAEVLPTAVEVRAPAEADVAQAEYFVEEVRRELIGRYGGDVLYGGGLSVRTTLDSHLQKIADTALRNGLSDYDRRHGWRGPLGRVDAAVDWRMQFDSFPFPEDVQEWRRAVVVKVNDGSADIGLRDGTFGTLPLEEMKWARRQDEKRGRGPQVRTPADVVALGDVIVVEPVARTAKGEDYPPNTYALRQIPEIGGALVALDPHTGRVLAMAGGFSAGLSEFNRATQASRQPGSAFKPFVYLAALDKGFTPSSLVLDAPFVIDQGAGLGRWRPSNYSNEFYGPSPLRLGLEKSRNLMTVRLAQNVGMETVAEYAERFGIVDRLPPMLSMALGAGETTLMRLTSAYGMLVNGGRRITPTLIDRIQDRTGRTVFRHDHRSCDMCREISWDADAVPSLPDDRAVVADPRTAYQIVSMLEGAVKRGTGRRISTIDKPLAGKTGTTNDSRDAWFVGFSPDLVVGVFAGFDNPAPLGRDETGSSVAAPIFKSFMEEALEDQPAIPFRVPSGIRLVRVDAETGRPAVASTRSAILEAFMPGTVPSGDAQVLDGSSSGVGGESGSATPTGGIRDLY
ncbi:MAG: penicillin-binding protein 1A [Rhodospirillaceae bacterium]